MGCRGQQRGTGGELLSAVRRGGDGPGRVQRAGLGGESDPVWGQE